MESVDFRGRFRCRHFVAAVFIRSHLCKSCEIAFASIPKAPDSTENGVCYSRCKEIHVGTAGTVEEKLQPQMVTQRHTTWLAGLRGIAKRYSVSNGGCGWTVTVPSSGGVGAAFRPSCDAREREGHSGISPVDSRRHPREALSRLTFYSFRNSPRNDVLSIWTHSPHYFIKRRLQENRVRQ